MRLVERAISMRAALVAAQRSYLGSPSEPDVERRLPARRA